MGEVESRLVSDRMNLDESEIKTEPLNPDVPPDEQWSDATLSQDMYLQTAKNQKNKRRTTGIKFLPEDKNNSSSDTSQNDKAISRFRTDIPAEVYDAFEQTANTQRGEPELAMTSVQKQLGGGILSVAIEHVGDLTHRMSEKGAVYGSEFVSPKVNQRLKDLKSGYGFLRDHYESLNRTIDFEFEKKYPKVKKDTPTYEKFKVKFKQNIENALINYSNQHKKIPVWNEMQLAAREAAIALGELDVNKAIQNLEIIKKALDDGTYKEKSIKFDKNIDTRNTRKKNKDNTQGFAQGGLADMNTQTQRAFAIGGEAETVDPVSGNDVPPGSLPEEVRDDIDAKLSEGEYVVPADVVRYYGVKFFENLRTKAKQGLQQMDEDGRIGGEPTLEMSLPFDISELEVEDDDGMRMAVGGLVAEYNVGGYQQASGVGSSFGGYGGYGGYKPYNPTVQPVTTSTPTPVAPTTTAAPINTGSQLKTYYDKMGNPCLCNVY